MKKKYLLAASLCEGIGIQKLKSIRFYLEHNLESAVKSLIPNIDLTNKLKEAEHILEIIDKNSIDLFIDHNEYPILFFKGDKTLLSKQPICGIVGTRTPYKDMVELTEIIAEELSINNTIISGLALGIDTAAHKGALLGKGKTIAVLPTGLLSVYPSENIELFEEISEKGLCVSPFLPNSLFKPFQAVIRNNLVADLSNNILLIQSSKKGGSRYAIERCYKSGKEISCINDKRTGFELNKHYLNLKNSSNLF